MSEINGHAIAQALFSPHVIAMFLHGKTGKCRSVESKVGVLVRPYIHVYFRLLNKGHDT